MKSLISIFREKGVLFFDPIKRHPVLMFVVTVIVSSLLYLSVNIGIAEVVRQNSYDIHILAAEQLNEIGPGFANESEQYAEIINRYTEHMEKRRLATLLRLLCPRYSPKKALASVQRGLKKAAEDKDEQKAEQAIYQAGLASNRLYVLSKRFLRSPIVWFKSEVVSDQLLADLDEALTKSTELADKLESERTMDAAIAACRGNRKGILLLFLYRLGFNDKEKIERFLIDIKRARDCTILLAERTGDETKQKFLYETASSENRRVKILEAMLDKDMEKACHLLTEAIERAFEKNTLTD